MAAITPDDFSDGTRSSEDLASLRARLTGRLNEFRGRVRWQVGLEGLARIAGALLGLGLLGLVLDIWLELSIVARMLFLIVIAVVVLMLGWRYLIHPLRVPWTPIDLAAALDRVGRRNAAQAIAPRVATVLQLSAHPDLKWKPSQVLIERAVRHSYSWLDRTNFVEHLNRRHFVYCLAALAGTVLFPTLLAAAFPTTARLWANRWLLGSNTPWPRYTTIRIIGEKENRLIVPRGEAALLRVLVSDERRPTETVWLRQEDADGNSETVVLESYGGGEFRRELPPLDEPVTISVWGGDGRIGPITVDPLDRPRINELKLVYRSPRDSSPHAHDFSGEDSNLALFAQTDAELTLVANVPIDNVEMTTESPGLNTFARVDERTFKTTWKHNAPVRMRVALTASESGLVSHPRPIAVGLKGDQPPTVSLSHTGVGSRVTAVATIPLKVLARDDLGLLSVVLHGDSVAGSTTTTPPATNTQHTAPLPGGSTESEGSPNPATTASPASADTNPSTSSVPDSHAMTAKSDLPAARPPATAAVSLFGPKPTSPETTVEKLHDWQLEPLQLHPGDVVRFFAETTDDCHLGPQTVRSRTVAFRVVAAEELFREILVRQQQLRARLRKATDEAENQRDQLRVAELPQQAGEFLRRHRLIQREVWQVHKALEDSATEMRLNRLGGPETHELMARQIVEPLGRVHDWLLSAQREAMEGLGQSEAEPLETTVRRQEAILAALQGVLANMRQWDSFIDVVNQLNSVIKLEQRIRDNTEQMRKSQFESIFDK